ncbi:MAG: hypothetical protein D6732_09145 [Methanobacteriota archaeon]|nr:MAG: hypothetical protein D6732_09145 [Euryarchaeota archaeon]
MLYLFPHEHCKECEEIRSRLKQLVLAHRVIQPGQAIEKVLEIHGDISPPVLIEGDKVIRGERAILKFLEELGKFKEEWDKFQSDSCYCGDNGEIE